jgi:hypothetical protein
MLNNLLGYWQEIIVGLIVISALLFLLSNWFFSTKKNASCGGCNSCDDKKECNTH